MGDVGVDDSIEGIIMLSQEAVVELASGSNVHIVNKGVDLSRL